MNITDVKVFPVNEDKLKAFVSIIFDDCFVVTDIKVINGNNGLFVSMPSKKRKNGTFRDIAHPLNNDTRRVIEERIFDEYYKVLNEQGGDESMAPREIEAVPAELLAPREIEAVPAELPAPREAVQSGDMVAGLPVAREVQLTPPAGPEPLERAGADRGSAPRTPADPAG